MFARGMINDEKQVLLLFLIICSTCYMQIIYPHPRQQLAMIRTGTNSKNPVTLLTAPKLDYTQKEAVRVGDVLTRQAAAAESEYFKYVPGQNMYGSQNVHNQYKPDGVRREVYNMAAKRQPIVSASMAKIIVQQQNVPQTDSSQRFLQADVQQEPPRKEPMWSPHRSQVKVNVFGQRIDRNALVHLRPNSSSSSIRKLRHILGPDFDADWTSINPPEENSRTARSTPAAVASNLDEKLAEALTRLNFTIYRQARDSNVAIPIHFGQEQVTLMKEWLLQRASCQMTTIWEDLGPMYWPRWIRRGVCSNTQSCSWPPVMRCHPSGSHQVKLLRWVCTNDARRINDAKARQKRDSNFRRTRRDGKHVLKRRYIDKGERRSRRVRRLISKLSLAADGYLCEWNRYEIPVSNTCSCGCG